MVPPPEHASATPVKSSAKNAKRRKRRHHQPAQHPQIQPVADEAEAEADAKPEEDHPQVEQNPSDEEGKEDQLDATRLERTLFVGNVAQTTTRNQIRRLFTPFGTVETVRIRNVIPANPRIPKKTALLANRLARFADSFSAYVVFSTPEPLPAAVTAVNMTILNAKHLRVTPAQQTRAPRRQSVFVGNLPFDCSEEELITAFQPIAQEAGTTIENARVNRDRDTGVGRGVGFVTFADILGVQACLNHDRDVHIRKRPVRVERALKTKNMKSKAYKAKKRNMRAAFGETAT